MNDSTHLRRMTADLLAIGIMISMTGCAMNGPSTTGDNPPDIPPASTFVMDFDDFSSGGTAKLVDGGPSPISQQVITNGNWGWGALHVGVWNVIVTVGMTVPVAAFLESFNHIPEQQSDGTWVWSYQVTISGILYSAELHALTVDGNIEWNMFISKEGFYDAFNWFSGVSNLPGTEGTWTLNNTPEDPTPLLSIEWHRDAVAETSDIKYINIVPDGPENGGYIFFGVTEGARDAFYEIFNKGENNTINIEWNRTGKDGRIRDVAHFGDDQWRCWDTALQDTECL